MIGLGKFTYPIMPQYVVLTDRADGKLWLLSHNNDVATPDGLGHVSITDAIPTNKTLTIYPINEEPWISLNPDVRFIVRGGHIGYEGIDLEHFVSARSEQRIVTRKSLQKAVKEIIIPSSFVRIGDTIGYIALEV